MTEAAIAETGFHGDRDHLLEMVLGSNDLPSLPDVASRLLTLMSREDTELSDVADLISKDVALCSKVIKVSNSAFYNFPQQITSIQQAISILGTNAVRSLVLSFSFLSLNKPKGTERFDFNQFWQRSLASAVSTKLILEQLPGVDAEQAFLAGLLQNLGELVLACTVPERFEAVLEELEKGEQDQSAIERELLQLDHARVGYEVSHYWSFPPALSLPILYHHRPEECQSGDAEIRHYTSALYLSDLLVNILYSEKPQEYHRRFSAEARRIFKFTPDQVEIILDNAHSNLDIAAQQFGLDMEKSRSVQEILQEANIRLSLLNLDYEQVNKELVQAKMALEKLTNELKEKNEILKDLANVDGLTGAYNNRFFQQALDTELKRSTRHKSDVSFILADIDHFKGFNDEYGHLVGDFVLAEFCKVLTGNLRQYDVLARYGGEEFAIILPDTGAKDAAFVAEKLRAAVEAAKFRDGGVCHSVTASFGVSSVTPVDEKVPDKKALIKTADEALYDAKKQGRNKVVLGGEKKKWFGRK
ncbi:sensor domain-containing diguanylate cyclase [Pseudohalioglobus lutimaris]|uniref:diguanylate cyclase n=1 Tax=Pseudohalioglobus lutimaris TaxID=1737061 RepID=A0A2N5X1Q1_9GAMM|nr:GGDEF domain-containing protein [Pseudohalioglobus lutimaris]PLW68409.1 GGDEF domain-containing protein [Pseudohalioglobus lutimaris]